MSLDYEQPRAGIVGIGSCKPRQVVTNLDLQELVDTSDEWILSRTGIRERRIADVEEAASDLALIASKKALADAGISPGEVDLIITATSTPDMIFPSTACVLQDRLGAVNAGAFDLSAGCTGFIYAVVVGAQFITAGTAQTVLVVGTEVISKFLNWQDRNTCVLFGDGAGAVVLRLAPKGYGIMSVNLGADGSGARHIYMPAGGTRIPASPDTVARNLHCLHMNGREVFKFAVRAMEQATGAVMHQAGLTEQDIDFLIPHQANVRIIELAAKRMNLTMDKVMVNVDKYGNTSAASVPLALEDALLADKIKDGDHVVMVGFGAGLTWAGLLTKWHDYKHA